MASTDIDGSPIVILSEDEARAIYIILVARAADRSYGLTPTEQKVADKISRDLGLSTVKTFKKLDAERSASTSWVPPLLCIQRTTTA